MDMGGPGGLGPPGGGVTGAALPLRGVVEARRAGTRGETSPLLSTLHVFFADCLLVLEQPQLKNLTMSNLRFAGTK
jgi:hypothetical protein